MFVQKDRVRLLLTLQYSETCLEEASQREKIGDKYIFFWKGKKAEIAFTVNVLTRKTTIWSR